MKNTSLVLYGLGNHGGKPTEFVGDTFATSNIQAPSTFKLYEAYLKNSIDDRFAVLIGLRDLNADYYSLPSSGTLLNSAFGISPSLSQTGSHGPSIFPVTSLALNFKYESPTSLYFQLGIFNALAGDPDKNYGTHINADPKEGYLLIAETGVTKSNDIPHKYSLGSWTYTESQLKTSSDTDAATNSGMYFLVDQGLCSVVSLFAKYGLASSDINKFNHSLETGFSFKGIIPHREDDRLTLGWARSDVAKNYRILKNSTYQESVIEANYQIKFKNGIALTPDIQWVNHPGLDTEVKDAWVGEARIEINF